MLAASSCQQLLKSRASVLLCAPLAGHAERQRQVHSAYGETLESKTLREDAGGLQLT